MVEASYRVNKMHYRYINCEVNPDQLQDAVAGAKAMNWKGFHCSIPHKVSVIKYLDQLGESAKVIGAVNCVVNRNGKLNGENTDGKGFLQSFYEIADPKGKTIVLLGAGGAARAIAVELALAGAVKFYIVNRGSQRGIELKELLNSKTDSTAEFISWNETYVIPSDADVLINSTSLGMIGEPVDQDIDYSSIGPGLIVADVIINPLNTAFLLKAAARGATTIQGIGMVVNQAVIAIQEWSGVDVNPVDLTNELMKALQI